MGSDRERRKQPRHDVTVSSPFWISSHEISLGQFRRFLAISEATGALDDWEADAEISPGDEHPANKISWVVAIRFCNWLSEQENLKTAYTQSESDMKSENAAPVLQWKFDTAANGYRLPTEAEWEYAARAGAQTRYTFGDDQDLHTHYVRTSASRKIPTLPCGSLMPNANGLFDVEGNVWEWAWDEWTETTVEPQIDPLGKGGAIGIEGSYRVIRGGGVDCYSGDSDLEARGKDKTDRLSWNVGFRVVRRADTTPD